MFYFMCWILQCILIASLWYCVVVASQIQFTFHLRHKHTRTPKSILFDLNLCLFDYVRNGLDSKKPWNRQWKCFIFSWEMKKNSGRAMAHIHRPTGMQHTQRCCDCILRLTKKATKLSINLNSTEFDVCCVHYRDSCHFYRYKSDHVMLYDGMVNLLSQLNIYVRKCIEMSIVHRK